MVSFYEEEENVNDPRDECEESPQSEEGEGREEPRSGKVNSNLIFNFLNDDMYKYIKHQPLRKPRSCNVDFDFFLGGGFPKEKKL